MSEDAFFDPIARGLAAGAAQTARTAAANTPSISADRPATSIFDPAGWSAHTRLFSVADTSAATLYWPWVIRTDHISSPLGKYYMYFSTDHDSGAGGIYLAYANNPAGPWTQYGRVFVDLAAGSNQTETPSVMWDPVNNNYRMFYQQYAARHGPGDSLTSIGAQSTLSAISTDGLSWTKDPNFFLDKLFITSALGDGHTGYFIPSRTRNGVFAYSLAGGGTPAHFIMWSCRGDLSTWISDWKMLGGEKHLVAGGDLSGRRIDWNSASIVNVKGEDLLIFRLAEEVSGSTPGNNAIAIAPLLPGYRGLASRPSIIWTAVESWETSDVRTASAFVDNGALYVFYAFQNHIGVFSHVL